jgi:hypothetical protein
VADALNFWRKNKKSNAERIPKYVLDLIGQIIPKYSKSKILRVLKIHADKYNEIKNSSIATDAKISATDENHFVPFRLVAASSVSDRECAAKCEIHGSKGAKLIICAPDVGAVIKAFLSCSS